MNSPFRFGKVVTGKHFINRTKDIARIQNNIGSGINTILISPRRWGKSSLVKQIEFLNKNKRIRFAFIDLFNIRTEEEFFEKYAREIIRCSTTKTEELIQSGKNFFKKITPSFSFGSDPINDFSLSFNWNDTAQSKDEIINLPQVIAEKKGITIVVCIDEFQNISTIKESIALEQQLRSLWQYHQDVAYCIYGSRKHMMLEIFKKESRAFFRFGDLYLLDKIPEDHWLKFIENSFKQTGKIIRKDQIETLIQMTDNHPDYLQQLCHNVWNGTETEVNEDIILEAMDLVLTSNGLHYQDVCESLSNTQFNLLLAFLAGEKQITATRTMRDYKLGTPRNVSKNKLILIDKDIIDTDGENILFNDPIFEYWLRNKYQK